MTLDLNCDLGEGESSARTRALMRRITSANVACGGHAGDVRTMAVCVRWAARHGVRIGAHPGLWSRRDFGRGKVSLLPHEFETLLIHQVGALQRIAAKEGAALHHIKLHGALYHASETNAALRRRYLEAAQRWWPELRIYAQAGGKVAQLARREGLAVVEEGFLDRAYLDARTLAPRSHPQSVCTDIGKVMERLRHWRKNGTVLSVSGKPHALNVETWCLHSDTPGALRLARAVGKTLTGKS